MGAGNWGPREPQEAQDGVGGGSRERLQALSQMALMLCQRVRALSAHGFFCAGGEVAFRFQTIVWAQGMLAAAVEVYPFLT